MSDTRPAEPWEMNVAGPYSTMLNTGRDVTIWALGAERHLVISDGVEHVADGHGAAHRLAHEPAGN